MSFNSRFTVVLVVRKAYCQFIIGGKHCEKSQKETVLVELHVKLPPIFGRVYSLAGTIIAPTSVTVRFLILTVWALL